MEAFLLSLFHVSLSLSSHGNPGPCLPVGSLSLFQEIQSHSHLLLLLWGQPREPTDDIKVASGFFQAVRRQAEQKCSPALFPWPFVCGPETLPSVCLSLLPPCPTICPESFRCDVWLHITLTQPKMHSSSLEPLHVILAYPALPHILHSSPISYSSCSALALPYST